MSFAVFDFDSTLVEGSLGSAFEKWLTEKKVIPEEVLEALTKAREKYKNNEFSYKEHQKAIILNRANWLKGKKQKEINNLVKEFSKEYKGFFHGAIDLVNFFKEKNFFLILISGAPKEWLKELNFLLGFDVIAGQEFETKEGKYTGKLINKMWIEDIKEKILLQIMKEKSLERKGSFGFGDSEQDVFMLKLVESPFCINSTEKLSGIAEEMNWKKFEMPFDALNFLKK